MSNQAMSSPPDSPNTSSVRRHHTISAHSRSARASAKDIISEETHEQQQGIWNDDEVVGEDWVGGVGAVGEKTSLHRQASLPTRYHRAFQNQAAKSSNQAVNTLAAIESNDVDEEPWKIDNYHVDEDDRISVERQQAVDAHAGSSLSPHYTNPSSVPSPPAAASSVRRHVSLTYGAGQQRKTSTGLKRAGTITNPLPAHSQQNPSPPETLEQAESDDNAHEPEDILYQEEYLRQQQQLSSNAALTPLPWTPGNDWRPTYAGGNGGTAIDDVQVALTALEIASNGAVAHQGYAQYQPTQAQPPRFTHQQHQSTGSRGSNGGYQHHGSRGSDYDGRKTPNSQRGGNIQQQQYGQGDRSGTWSQKEQNLRGSASNPNLRYGSQQSGGHTKASSGSAVPSVPPIPPQYLQQQGNQVNRQGLGIASGFNDAPNDPPPPVQPLMEAPIDISTLVATKGYNPAQFDIRPPFARYFVIKSYTEDDVHKSLKYEIWSSTDPGNKRLDKAFKETAGRGPIYLFFSVNASGHFCGMAEMLTPVDYTRNSTVWASDKWKGVFKVHWIFVRDIPNVTLRHIKLLNTQEKKPVTNSRDTQELLPDAGQEMLRIFHTHPARTTLLQDFAFYEAIQKAQGVGSSGPPPPPPALSSPQLHATTISNTNAAFSYNMPSVIGVGGYSGTQGLHPQAHAAMHHSVLRHPSPGPQQHQAQQQALGAQGNYGSY